MNLALKSTPLVMIDAADYLNTKGEHDKAATLYMKGGKLSKAVEMCFNGKLFDVLQHIADDLQVCGVWVRVHTHSQPAYARLPGGVLVRGGQGWGMCCSSPHSPPPYARVQWRPLNPVLPSRHAH